MILYTKKFSMQKLKTTKTTSSILAAQTIVSTSFIRSMQRIKICFFQCYHCARKKNKGSKNDFIQIL